MKPVMLDMTAFGSYVKLEEPIDFRRFDHSLYLIAGDTGAGKTTIFDGIMYALYGVTSGGETGRKGKQEKRDGTFRTPEMMHCDYVDRSVDTVVKLTFEHMGKVHTVERTLHFQKEQKTGAYHKAVQKAEFWEQGKEVIKKPETVTGRITELLGMNADQFRKIVVLAQGEFKRFLDADSETKNQILGDLFDNFTFVYFQDVLDRARMKLEQQRRTEGTDRIRRAMEDFRWPMEISEEERESCTAGHSRLEEVLAEVVRRDRRLLEELRQGIEAYEEQTKELHIRSGRAEEQNKKLEELEQKEEHLKELQAKKPEMDLLEEQKNRTDRAFHRIKPEERLFETARKTCEDAEEEIHRLEKALGELEQEKKKAKALLEQCERENGPAAARLEADLLEIGKMLPRYEELENRYQAQVQNHTDRRQAELQRQKAEEAKKRTEDGIGELDQKIKESDGIEVAAERLQGKLERASDRLSRLTGEDGVREQMDRIRLGEKELKEEQAVLQKITGEAGSLEAVYHKRYQAFINGQAGVLARDLERELKEKQEAVCPVCRTVFHGRPPHGFAELTGKIPEQEEVNRAKAESDHKEQERQEQEKKVLKLCHVLQDRKNRIAEQLRELLPDCPDPDMPKSREDLEHMIADYEAAEQEAEAAYRKAQKQKEDLLSWKTLLSGKKDELEKQKAELEACKEQEQSLKEAGIRIGAELEELKRTLRYPDKKTAEKQKRQWEEEKEERTAKIREAETHDRETEKEYNEKLGALDTGRKNLPILEEKKEQAFHRLTGVTEECGFQSQEEVQKVLQEAGESDAEIEAWLTAKEEELRNYRNGLDNTEKRIGELRKETEGLKKVDLEQLHDDIRELEEARETVRRKQSECEKQYENHKNTVAVVQKAGRVLSRTETAWKRLDTLADLAAGKRNAAGGKLSFDRYVMGDVFKEVLEMANRQLDIISGGRYELIHERNTRNQNAKAGLEISVLDMTTGKRRPSSSLSGGESFFVSLSLALGLSDVVQNHAGGKQLDALFIDEGFGSLDNDVLDRALLVLNQLTEGRRLVGIISHVARLEESIPQQIRVKNGEKGSILQILN